VRKRRRREPAREKRICTQVTVDAYSSEEQSIGWYYYLQESLRFPFPAVCIRKRSISPLRQKAEVQVLGMAEEGECEREMFVTIPWKASRLAVPLSQLEPGRKTDPGTKQAVADWHYWVDMGYEL